MRSNGLPVRSALGVLGIGALGFVVSALLWYLAAFVMAILQGPGEPV
jgi:hypothetical protein